MASYWDDSGVDTFVPTDDLIRAGAVAATCLLTVLSAWCLGRVVLWGLDVRGC